MKYLVNRETKAHLNYDSVSPHFNCVGWDVIKADDDGFIEWEGGECPLNEDQQVEVVCNKGFRQALTARAFDWKFRKGRIYNIISYRPILPAESKPVVKESFTTPGTLEETWDVIEESAKVDVFARLSDAVAASESIPALIAEINAMLPEGYEVREKAKPPAIAMNLERQRDYIFDYLNPIKPGTK